MVNQSNPVTASILRATEAAGRQIGMKQRVIDGRRQAELDAAFETLRRAHADALVLVADPMLFTERASIIQLAARHRVPAVYEHRLFPEVGCLVSYGPLPQERFQRIAVYVDRILRGARPGDLPASSRPRSSW